MGAVVGIFIVYGLLIGFILVMRHRAIMVKWWGTIILIAPVLWLVAMFASNPFMSIASGNLPHYILSGKLFSERFDIRHAGMVLDQPTIGKWLFWFTVMAIISFPYIIMLRWVSDRRNLIGRFAFAIPVAVICVLLLCILTWPLSWLVQYVHSMGFTPKRIFGLVYGTTTAIGVILFFIWAVRRPK